MFVYLDDILILSKTREEYVHHVQQVLQRLWENRLYVKAKNFEFHVTTLPFLGIIIKSRQVKTDPEKMEAVAEWPVPENCKQLQRFLDFASFYRWLIKDFSRVATPFTHLTSTSIPFVWTREAQAALGSLKSVFISTPVLVQPNPALQFVVEVNTSDNGVGVVLSQHSELDRRLHLCAFFSRKLSPAEHNYVVGDRKLLTIKLALEESWNWLESSKQPFVVWTDHKNLAFNWPRS